MRLFQTRPVTFVEAQVIGTGGVIGSSIRLYDARVEGLDCTPSSGDVVVDLQGALVLPGLINAHDHLELNNFPRLKWRDQYANVREWIEDFQPRFRTDPALSVPMSASLSDRLFQGGIKNLLGGATTVCHHNPLYRSLRHGFPVKVVKRYRYSHSLFVDGEKVKHAHTRTPASWPWIIHAAEGTDASAHVEFGQLDRWGCIGPNTVLVHGVGLSRAEMSALVTRGGGLVWCPSSNDYLLGATADVSLPASHRRLALGTDSRLSGERDLMAELRYAATRHHMSAENLLRMVTVDAASLLKLSGAGELRIGAPADLIILPAGQREPLAGLLTGERSNIRLVLLEGRALVGDADMLPVFNASGTRCVEARVDSCEKLIAEKLATRCRRCVVREPGLQL